MKRAFAVQDLRASLRPRVRFGVALEPGLAHVARIHGVLRSGASATWEVVRIESAECAGVASLTSLLRALRAQARGRRATVHVALLPPLCDVKILRFPPLSDAEIRSVLAHDARRYFAFRGTVPVAASLRATGGGRAPRELLVAIADEALIESLRAAAAVAGVRLASIGPAHAAWLAGARNASPHRRWPAESALAVVRGGDVEVMQLRRGYPVRYRRLVAGAGRPISREDIMLAVGSPLPSEARVSGERPAADCARMPLTVLGTPTPPPDPPPVPAPVAPPVPSMPPRPRISLRRWDDDVPPEVVAARFAATARRAEFASAGEQRARERRARVRAGACCGVAAALWIAIAGLTFLDASRELAAVRSARARLAGAVATAVAQRDSVQAAAERASALAELDSGRVQWSEELIALAERLARDAHVLSLRAEGDSVALELAAASARSTMHALARPAAVTDIRLTAPVRRGANGGLPGAERFAVVYRFVSPNENEP